jgi:hypothetical protein
MNEEIKLIRITRLHTQRKTTFSASASSQNLTSPAAVKAVPAQGVTPAQAAVEVEDYSSALALAQVLEAVTAGDYSSALAVTVTAAHCTSALALVAECMFASAPAAESLFLTRSDRDALPAALDRAPETRTFPHSVVRRQAAPAAAAQADRPTYARYRP